MEKQEQHEVEQTNNRFRPLVFAGFFIIIFLLSWAAIQLVQVLPSAFGSLASLAEGVDQYRDTVEEDMRKTETDTFTLSSNTSLVNAGATVDLNWTTIDRNGDYIFTYECLDGVAVMLMKADGTTNLSCNNSYNLGKDTSATLQIESEKDRYVDLVYNLAFLGQNESTPKVSDSGVVTVVNETITDETTSPAETETELEEVVDTTPEIPTTPVEPTSPTPTVPVTPQPEYTYEYEYAIPTSNPNGFTDLGLTIVASGKIIGNSFFPTTIKEEENGALQFTVRNFGTKTSDEWTYKVTLPGGTTYESDAQKALKPNEVATIAVGFLADDDSTHNFTVTIATDRDTYSQNNSAARLVPFVK